MRAKNEHTLSGAPSLVPVARLLFVVGLGALGCGEDMSVGTVDPNLNSCSPTAPCPPPTIDLPDDYVGVAARATSVLTPVWTLALPGETDGARASGGNVWLATQQGETILVRRVDDQGASAQEVTLASPSVVPNSTVHPRLHGITPHAKGPVVSVSWSHLAAPGLDCAGKPRSPDSGGSFTALNGLLECKGGGSEVVVFDSANLAAPVRFNPCVHVSLPLCTQDYVYRSGDGQSLLFSMFETLVEETLDSQVVSQSKVPRDFHALHGTAVDEHGWTFYGAGGAEETLPGGLRGLVTFARGGTPSVTYLQGADISGPGTGDGLVLPGPGPAQSIAVFDRRAGSSSQGGASELPGDIAVVWLEAGVLKSQRVLARQDYAGLPLTAAGVDDSGTVYILTSTGNRAATLNHTLTTLVCRVPVAAEGACFELPTPDAPDPQKWLSRGIYALRENVLIVHTGTQLMRVDLPL